MFSPTAGEVTSFAAIWLWTPVLQWAFSSIFAMRNLLYIHKDVPECASILNSVWWIFHAVSCTLLWRKIGLHSYTAKTFRGTINYRNHCVFFTWIAVTQTPQRKERKERGKKVRLPSILGKGLLSPLGGFIYKLHTSCFHPSAQRYQSRLWAEALECCITHCPENVLSSCWKGFSLFPMGQMMEASEQKTFFFFFLQRITMYQNIKICMLICFNLWFQLM